MAKFCNFGNQSENLIRDAVILGINDKNLRSLLFEEKNLTIGKLKIIYKTYILNMKKMKGAPRELMALNVQPVIKGKSRDSSASRRSGNPKKVDQCWKCGQYHPPNVCPAFNSVCVDCKQINHFSHCCPIAKLDNVKIDDVPSTTVSYFFK